MDERPHIGGEHATLTWSLVERTPAAQLLALDDGGRASLELLVAASIDSASTVRGLGRWLVASGDAVTPALQELAQGSLWCRGFAAGLFELALDESWHDAWTPLLWRLASHPSTAVWYPAVRALGRLASRDAACLQRLIGPVGQQKSPWHRRTLAALAHTATAHDDVVRPALEARFEHWLKGNGVEGWEPAALGVAVPEVWRTRPWLRERMSTLLEVCNQGRAMWQVPYVWALADGLTRLLACDPRDDGARAALHAIGEAWRDPGALTSYSDAQLVLAALRALDAAEGRAFDAAWPAAVGRRLVAAAVTEGAATVTRSAFELADVAEALLPDAYARLVDESASRLETAAAAATIDGASFVMAQRPWEAIARAAGAPGRASEDVALRHRACLEDVVRRGLLLPGQRDPERRVLLRAAGLLLDADGNAASAQSPSSERPARFVLGLLADFFCAVRDQAKRRAMVAPSSDSKPPPRASKHPPADPQDQAVRALSGAIREVLWRVQDQLAGDRDDARDFVRMGRRLMVWGALMIPGAPMPKIIERSRADGDVPEEVVSISADMLRNALAAGPAVTREMLGRYDADATRLGGALILLARQVAELRAQPALAPGADIAVFQARLGPLRTAIQAVLGWLADPVRGLREDLAAATTSRPPSAVAATLPALLGDAAGELIDRTVDALDESAADAKRIASAWVRGLGPVLEPWVAEALDAWFQAARSDRSSSVTPTVIGGYTLVRRLREGGMGTTWLVSRDGATGGAGTYFVMKRPRSAGICRGDDPARFRRFLAGDVGALKALRCNHIVQYIDDGDDPTHGPYLVMEHLRGADLETYARARPLSLREVQRVVEGVVRGLGRIHGRSLVHRDVKPSNVFLCLDLDHNEDFISHVHRDPYAWPIERVVVIDFGIVFDAPRALVAGQAAPGAGTPGYMAPEQWDGGATVTPAADVYGLAATVYTAMTGRTFFQDVPQGGRVEAMRTREPLADDRAARGLPRGALALLREATRRDPKGRIDLESFGRRFLRLRG